MGLLVDGVWRDEWYDTKTSGGRFERPPTKFHDRIDADGRFPPCRQQRGLSHGICYIADGL